MGLTTVVGRLLVAAIFILAGVQKFQQPEGTAAFMASRYEVVFKHVQPYFKQYEVPIPDQLKPSSIKQVSNQIVLGVAGVEVLGGVLTVLNVGFGAFLLQVFLLATLAIIHNPFLFNATPEEALHEQTQFLKNLAIFGGLSFIGSKACCAVKTAPAHEAKKSQPQKGQTAPTQAAKPAQNRKGKKD